MIKDKWLGQFSYRYINNSPLKSLTCFEYYARHIAISRKIHQFEFSFSRLWWIKPWLQLSPGIGIDLRQRLDIFMIWCASNGSDFDGIAAGNTRYDVGICPSLRLNAILLKHLSLGITSGCNLYYRGISTPYASLDLGFLIGFGKKIPRTHERLQLFRKFARHNT